MKIITDQEANHLQKEIDYILDSGANSIRLLNMFDTFLDRRNLVNKIELTDEQILEKYGWTIVCEIPFEIRNGDGSFASGQAAYVMKDAIIEEYKEEKN